MLKSGVVFLYIPLFMSITFPKNYKTPEELVELLFERGLYIHEKGSACRYIRNIGYYRLSAYLYPFLKFPKEKQFFKDGSTLEGALMLYRFDKKIIYQIPMLLLSRNSSSNYPNYRDNYHNKNGDHCI